MSILKVPLLSKDGQGEGDAGQGRGIKTNR